MMLCPFCNSQMEKGFLQSGSIMVWVTKKHHLSLLPKEGEILLDRKYLTNCAVPSWNCRNCRKIITGYEEKLEFESSKERNINGKRITQDL